MGKNIDQYSGDVGKDMDNYTEAAKDIDIRIGEVGKGMGNCAGEGGMDIDNYSGEGERVWWTMPWKWVWNLITIPGREGERTWITMQRKWEWNLITIPGRGGGGGGEDMDICRESGNAI